MNASDRRDLIEHYRETYWTMSDALWRIGSAAFDQAPSDDDWTPRQLVHHLAESEMEAALLIGRVLTDAPVIDCESHERPCGGRLCAVRSVGVAVNTIRAVRMSTAELLEHLTEAEWGRPFVSHAGRRYTLETWFQAWVEHIEEHTRQVLSAGQVERQPAPLREMGGARTSVARTVVAASEGVPLGR